MSVTVKCECGQTLVVPDRVAGKRGKCPKCGRLLSLDLEAPGKVVAPPPKAGGRREAGRHVSAHRTAAPAAAAAGRHAAATGPSGPRPSRARLYEMDRTVTRILETEAEETDPEEAPARIDALTEIYLKALQSFEVSPEQMGEMPDLYAELAGRLGRHLGQWAPLASGLVGIHMGYLVKDLALSRLPALVAASRQLGRVLDAARGKVRGHGAGRGEAKAPAAAAPRPAPARRSKATRTELDTPAAPPARSKGRKKTVIEMPPAAGEEAEPAGAEVDAEAPGGAAEAAEEAGDVDAGAGEPVEEPTVEATGEEVGEEAETGDREGAGRAQWAAEWAAARAAEDEEAEARGDVGRPAGSDRPPAKEGDEDAAGAETASERPVRRAVPGAPPRAVLPAHPAGSARPASSAPLRPAARPRHDTHTQADSRDLPDVPSLMRDAARAVDLQDWASAQALYEEAMGLAPENPAAALEAGHAALERSNWIAAAGHLARALELAPRDPEAFYWMARLFFSAEILEVGRRYFERYEHLLGKAAPPERQFMASLLVKSQGEGGVLYLQGQRVGPLPISLPRQIPPARLRLEVRDRPAPLRRSVLFEPAGCYRWMLDWEGHPEVWEETRNEVTVNWQGEPRAMRDLLARWIKERPGL